MGTEVHLGSALEAESSAHRDHVLRHELAHVVQQAHGLGDDPARLEHDAERMADGAAHAPVRSALRPLGAPVPGRAQAYDPRFHRLNTVRSLVKTGFSDAQIGQIYAANWERDLSQAHPSLGEAIRSWKAVKVAAYRRNESEFALASGMLRSAVASLLGQIGGPKILDDISGAMILASSKSYGGYRFYEHFDNPTAPSFTKKPNDAEGLSPESARRLRAMNGRLPQYIVDGREYIKAQLVLATHLYRTDFADASSRGVELEFGKRANALRREIKAGPEFGGVDVNYAGDPTNTLLAPIAAETSIQVARERGRRRVLEGNAVAQGRFTPEVADALGRAEHALQDFFSHSNFVELQIGEPTPGMIGLETGTFESNDSMHALSHKLRGLVDDLDNNSFVLRAALGDGKLPAGAFRMDLASDSRPQPSHWAGGGVPNSTGTISKNLAKLRDGEALTGQDVETTVGLIVPQLSILANKLEERSRTKAAAGSHTRIAKDQPGHDAGDPASDLKTRKFEFAQALSQRADRLVIGAMPAVFTAATALDADNLLWRIFGLLDRLIDAPSRDHPLADLFESY
jgi:hypothetical protein